MHNPRNLRKLVPLTAKDAMRIVPQAMQTSNMDAILENPRNYLDMCLSGPSFAMYDGLGLSGIGGVIPVWRGRAVGWVVVDRCADRHGWLWATRRVREYLDSVQAAGIYRRIETAVCEDFTQGHRWARLLGFVKEGTMKAYTPDGLDYALYARVV